jgi:hypothetical protein
MAKEWTKKERKEQIGEKYRSLRSKVFVLASMVILFLLLLWGIFHAIKTANSDLMVLMIIALIAFVPLAVFLIDLYWFEFQ